jgi:hypothetical protein
MPKLPKIAEIAGVHLKFSAPHSAQAFSSNDSSLRLVILSESERGTSEDESKDLCIWRKPITSTL